MEIKLNHIYCGDALEILKTFPDECIDLVVTSPPYDNLRDYGNTIWNFESIARELLRVTVKGGICVWIVGDKCEQGSESGTSFKQALCFKKMGFNLHDTMIYAKLGTAFPSPLRYHQCFEYMFIFSRGQPKTVNLIKDRNNLQANKVKKHRWERKKNGNIKFRHKDKYQINAVGSRWNIWYYDIGYNKTTKYTPAFKHPAMFPEALAKDHIISWSNKNDIVLDPFIGSGTTAIACIELNRKYIGIEINPEYVKIAEQRIKNTTPSLF